MTSYQPPLDEIRFTLNHLAGLEGLARLPGLEAASPDVVDHILAEAGRFAANELAPLNAPGDRQRARLENGAVVTPDGFKQAYAKFVAGGWHGLQFPPRRQCSSLRIAPEDIRTADRCTRRRACVVADVRS
jgi:acyl-CoA dehydrogenase